MEAADLKQYIELMDKHALVELEVEEKGRRIHLKKNSPPSMLQAPLYAMPPLAHTAPAAPGAPTEEAIPANWTPVRSPMVGTFYRAPAPDADSFVELGTAVKPESPVCIIEAMKVMNEIHAETEGLIRQILVENGKPVEFNQVLFYVESV